MATYRRPKGSYNRPTPDFFADRAATVGAFYWPTAAVSTTFDLYNNASDGSSLHLWAAFVGNDAAGLYAATQLKGHGANFARNSTAVITASGQLPGQLWIDTQAPQFSTLPWDKDTIYADAWVLDNEAGSLDNLHSGGPICIIQPGYSFRVYPLISSAQSGGDVMAVTFYFLALQGATN